MLPARKIFEWYNSALESSINLKEECDFENIRDLLIIGNGNITCDISRVLLRDPAFFDSTDMHSSVINVLKNSSLKNIQSVARRGLTHVAFTLSELRDLV